MPAKLIYNLEEFKTQTWLDEVTHKHSIKTQRQLFYIYVLVQNLASKNSLNVSKSLQLLIFWL